jgi:hypothetical protein
MYDLTVIDSDGSTYNFTGELKEKFVAEFCKQKGHNLLRQTLEKLNVVIMSPTALSKSIKESKGFGSRKRK